MAEGRHCECARYDQSRLFDEHSQRGPDRGSSELPADERDILNYTLQVTRTHKTDAALFKTLHDRYGAKWLVELTATLNFFVFVAGIANAFEVDVPEDADPIR